MSIANNLHSTLVIQKVKIYLNMYLIMNKYQDNQFCQSAAILEQTNEMLSYTLDITLMA